jgi:hypothetical protein
MTLLDIKQLNDSNHAFLSFHAQTDRPVGSFALALKDNILMQGETSSAGSAMLA